MRLRYYFVASVCLFTLGGCALDADQSSEEQVMTKEEARTQSGKADGIDWCDWMGWYGDGVCDDWCPQPDPDCQQTQCGPTTCATDMVCCNESCGICTPPGWSCIQIVCEPEEKTCGGRIGDVCDDDEYCDFEDITGTACGFADGTGVCKPMPEACSYLFAPVCGCDHNTYDNECFANTAGVDVQHEGPCADDREIASGWCVKNSLESCTSDADCVAGGCGGELCYNPALGGGASTCECTTPTGPAGCGCVDGQCAWYN